MPVTNRAVTVRFLRAPGQQRSAVFNSHTTSGNCHTDVSDDSDTVVHGAATSGSGLLFKDDATVASGVHNAYGSQPTSRSCGFVLLDWTVYCNTVTVA
jgi:hypothetical protein